MRIIDWSSDVCSSDLHKRPLRRRRHDLAALEKLGEMSADERARLARLDEDLLKNPADAAAEQRLFAGNVRQLIATLDRLASAYGDEKLAGMKTLEDAAIGRASWRERVCQDG